MHLEGIPETISRADYQRLVESVGLDTKHLRALKFAPDGIYATVFAYDENGRHMADKDDEGHAVAATHEVYIRAVDE